MCNSNAVGPHCVLVQSITAGVQPTNRQRLISFVRMACHRKNSSHIATTNCTYVRWQIYQWHHHCRSLLTKNQGLKYLKMSTTHTEGRWRGRRPRARHGGAKRRSAGGVRSGEGRRSPSPVWGSGGNLTVQICSFLPWFKDRDSSSIRCFSFIYGLYLFIIDHPVVFRKVNTVKQNSEIWQSSLAKLCLDNATLELNTKICRDADR